MGKGVLPGELPIAGRGRGTGSGTDRGREEGLGGGRGEEGGRGIPNSTLFVWLMPFKALPGRITAVAGQGHVCIR